MALRAFLFQSAEGYAEVQAATDELQLGKLTLSGVGGIALDGGATRAANFADPTSPQDLATKFYVDAVASGLDPKASVRLATAAALPTNTPAGTGIGKTLTADANGALSVDGVAVAVGNRILVKNEADAENNGIYTVTAAGGAGAPYVLTRATDSDDNSGAFPEVTGGNFVFSTEGTANADKGWVLTTNDPITIDTDDLVWTQFSASAAYTFGQGLLLTGVDVTIELDTAADAQGAGAAGGSSGLEFDANTASGKLRAAVHATGGLERTATGLAVKLNGTSITSGAGGLSVASAPAAGAVQETLTADEAIAVGDPVSISAATANRHVKGLSNSDAKSRITHVATTLAAGAASTFTGVAHGKAVGVISGATQNTPYYLQAAGGLGTALPGAGNRVIQAGIALSATDLFVRIIDYGKKAA